MKSYSNQIIEKSKERLNGIKPSHADAHKIKEGWQMGMYEKEITNYDGFGCVISVIGRTQEEAELLALIICRKVTLNQDTSGGTYDGIDTLN